MQKRQVNESRVFFGVLAGISLFCGLSIFFFVHSGFLRYYASDIVAVTFLYSIAQLTLRQKPIIATTGVLAVAIGIELMQALVTLPRSTISTLTLGSTFDLVDLLVYFVTALVLYSLDSGLRASSSASTS